MLTTRVLPVSEWPKLDATYLAPVWRAVDPAYFSVLVVEDGDQIVGTWARQLMVHVEGLWIHEDHRLSGDVFRALEVGMADLLHQIGASTALTEAGSDQIARFLVRRDAVPVPTYRIPFQARADRTRGHAFHLQLHAAGIAPTHPEDDAHDTQVGQALRMAFDEGDPVRAVTLYNAWAAVSGYEPIHDWTRDDAGVTVSFGDTLTLRLTRDGQV
jgi:hypothetical protein